MFTNNILIPVTALTHDVTSASKLRKSHFRRIQKSHSNAFCLPVDPQAFRHKFDCCHATLNTILRQTHHYISFETAWSDKTRHKMFKCSFLFHSLCYTILSPVVQTHTHAKRHQTPLKNDVALLTTSLSSSSTFVCNSASS